MHKLNLAALSLRVLSLATLTEAADNASEAVYRPQYNDDCTNECSDSDPRYWCGKPRLDSHGYVMKCQQYTKYGSPCVAECGGKEEYSWCLTNAWRLQSKSNWEYCSLAGHTINRAACLDSCDRRGEQYFWCHTEDSEWDYCSPPGLVKPLQYTIYGSSMPCIDECAKRDENYYWCHRSRRYYDKHSKDYNWEYCSPSEDHTIYNNKCSDKCRQEGEDYFWCATEGGSWDYCSPKAHLSHSISESIELTRYGKKCRDKCSNKGYPYSWCQTYSYATSYYNSWEYCSLVPGETINKVECEDECEQRGENYYWCNTYKGWDYCSPKYDLETRDFGYESVN